MTAFFNLSLCFCFDGYTVVHQATKHWKGDIVRMFLKQNLETLKLLVFQLQGRKVKSRRNTQQVQE